MLSGHWWVTDLLNGAGRWVLACWVFWVITSIVLHELSHGWAALRAGDRTPVETGHMTWSPLVHMGPASLVMFAIIGIAWGAMPINPARFRGRHDRSIVALAGPLMNLSLYVTCIIGGVALLVLHKRAHFLSDDISLYVFQFFFFGAILNFALMIFNLIPVPPLDGSRIVADLFPPYQRLLNHPRATVFVAIAFIVVFLNAGDAAFAAAGKVTTGTLDVGLGLFGMRPVP